MPAEPGWTGDAADLARRPWPAFDDVRGELVFDRQGMQLKRLSATLPGVGSGALALREVAGGLADLGADAPLLKIDGRARGPLDDALRRPSLATSEPTGHFPSDVEVHRDSPFRACVSIMEGCDNFCAFCVVPLTRGRERSRPPEDILREVATLRERGYREITLLGQTVNSYGTRLTPPISCATLLRRIDREVGRDVRVRFTTSHPKDVSADLADAMATLASVCPHMHLPVQAGSTRTLARMKRTYTPRRLPGKGPFAHHGRTPCKEKR